MTAVIYWLGILFWTIIAGYTAGRFKWHKKGNDGDPIFVAVLLIFLWPIGIPFALFVYFVVKFVRFVYRLGKYHGEDEHE